MTTPAELVARERMRQDKKWGQQDHDDEVWIAILTEEVGEAARCVLHDRFGGKDEGRIVEELVQVAAVAQAWIECVHRRGS